MVFLAADEPIFFLRFVLTATLCTRGIAQNFLGGGRHVLQREGGVGGAGCKSGLSLHGCLFQRTWPNRLWAFLRTALWGQVVGAGGIPHNP